MLLLAILVSDLHSCICLTVSMNVDGLSLNNIGNATTVVGLPRTWSSPNVLRSTTGSDISVGDAERLGVRLTLPAQAVVVHRVLDAGTPMFLPHPRSVTVDGRECKRFTLLFAKADVQSLQPFHYPPVPANVYDNVRQKLIPTSPVRPNSRYPVWLHDLHLTPSRDATVAKKHGERAFWRTWHPIIDPVWWCYYDHDDGTYPGHYLPAFHYTAFKTPDTTAPRGHQEESHNGFKVFSFPLHDQQKFVVIVVHMLLSRARRFKTRHHTMLFAILDADWKLEAELSMKADFGAAVVTRADRANMPISLNDAQILDELKANGLFAIRRFNILNVDNQYPQSVNKSFLLHNFMRPSEDNKQTILKGIYEQWRAGLATCLEPTSTNLNRGFNFDVRNPSTAMRFVNATSDASMQRLVGDNVNRFLKLRDSLVFGRELCHFENGRAEKAAVFYTDPYFKRLEEGSAPFALRQFLSPSLGPINLKKGLLLPTGPWSEPMAYVPPGTKRVDGRRLENIENAVRDWAN